jgi:hypothetical protein
VLIARTERTSRHVRLHHGTMTALGHVWTAPFWQGLIEGDAGWSVLSCVRPVDAAWVPLALMLPADRAPKS